MNTDLTFRFVTRTLTEDYRVFGDGGTETYSDSTEFEPLRRKGRIIPEEGACAVLWEEDGRIFLTVSSMQRGVKDFANRPIRFSFCWILADRSEAWAAFTRIISDFGKAEKVMQSLIREKPKTDNDGEDVEFQQDSFMSWLQEGRRDGVKFSQCIEGDVITREGDTWPEVWPAEGLLLKWRKTEDDEISCERVNNPKLPAKSQEVIMTDEVHGNPDRPQKLKWFIVMLCGVIIAAAVCIHYLKPAERYEPVPTINSDSGQSVDVPPVSAEPQDSGL